MKVVNKNIVHTHRPNASEWLKEDKLKKLQELSANGCSMDEIAQAIGIGKSTLYDWGDRHPQIQQAIKKGREKSVDMVENALFKSAINGNVTAMIFYLKNKAPDRYKDKVDTNSNIEVKDIKIKIE